MRICFWDTSRYQEIAKAIEFLGNFDLEDKFSIIYFSDVFVNAMEKSIYKCSSIIIKQLRKCIKYNDVT